MKFIVRHHICKTRGQDILYTKEGQPECTSGLYCPTCRRDIPEYEIEYFKVPHVELAEAPSRW